jgi:hypothetical protein
MLEGAIIVVELMKPDVLPETHLFWIGIHDVKIALPDALLRQGGKALLRQCATDAVSPQGPLGREMAQNPTPALVTAQDGSNDAAFRLSHKTQPLVPLQV